MCCSFGLFEAMSAIEMMDPKMDAGMLCNQVQRDVYTMDKAIQVQWKEMSVWVGYEVQ